MAVRLLTVTVVLLNTSMYARIERPGDKARHVIDPLSSKACCYSIALPHVPGQVKAVKELTIAKCQFWVEPGDKANTFASNPRHHWNSLD